MKKTKSVGDSRTFAHIREAFSLNEKAVLDVGCSEGDYLQYYGKGSMGVTIIEEHVRAAQKNGLNVALKNVEDPDFALPVKFDVVWANNLFEHMNAPHLFLAKMRGLLKEDGILILGVPVLPYFSWLTYFKKFRGAYAVSHVNFFNRKTLIETVKAGGWVVKEARSFHSKNVAIDWFLNLVAPHIYVVATPKPDFVYPYKRLLSLKGYK